MFEITWWRWGRAFVSLIFAAAAALAGPPFQTDDPEPFDFINY
jgi:hypothetical protein